ncbi:MAG: DUF4164 family protein [Alphaproteobacteria bacterium]|nr:DUF4164 family protein [Alphaproteobacteria bacterium]
MNRLDSALKRFSTALDSLETVVVNRLASAHEAKNSRAELEILKADRERLIARIAALEEDSRMLAGLTEGVEDRLDSAIAEIRDVLGRN